MPTRKDKKTKETLKREKPEQLETPDNKRMRLGPPNMPNQWRNRSPSQVILSFDVPVFEDGTVVVFLQATSQIQAFRRYSLQVPSEKRVDQVLDSPMGCKELWSPQTYSYWDVCKKGDKYQVDIAATHVQCALCPGARCMSCSDAVGTTGCTPNVPVLFHVEEHVRLTLVSKLHWRIR